MLQHASTPLTHMCGCNAPNTGAAKGWFRTAAPLRCSLRSAANISDTRHSMQNKKWVVEQDPPQKRARYEDYRPVMASVLVKKMLASYTPAKRAKLVKDSAAEFGAHAEADLNYKYLAQDTLRRLETDGRLDDAARSGRPEKADDKAVGRMLDVFLKGVGVLGSDEWWGYTSLHHGLQESATLREELRKSGVSAGHMWKRMKGLYRQRYRKRLKPIHITIKPKLTQAAKNERLRKARQWRGWGKSKLLDIVWIDEKQEYLRNGGTYRCYAPFGTRSMQREGKIKLGKAEKVKYEAAVSAFAGPIYIELTSGTTGLKTGCKVRIALALQRSRAHRNSSVLTP